MKPMASIMPVACRYRVTRAVLLVRVGCPDCQISNESSIIHLKRADNGMRNILRAEFSFTRFLLQAGDLKELGQDFTRIDLHDTNIVLAQFRAPTLCHSGQRKFTGRIGRASRKALRSRGRGDVDDVPALAADE